MGWYLAVPCFHWKKQRQFHVDTARGEAGLDTVSLHHAMTCAKPSAGAGRAIRRKHAANEPAQPEQPLRGGAAFLSVAVDQYRCLRG